MLVANLKKNEKQKEKKKRLFSKLSVSKLAQIQTAQKKKKNTRVPDARAKLHTFSRCNISRVLANFFLPTKNTHSWSVIQPLRNDRQYIIAKVEEIFRKKSAESAAR